MKLTVNLGANSYPIYIKNNILSQADTYIHEAFRGHKIMIISDAVSYTHLDVYKRQVIMCRS